MNVLRRKQHVILSSTQATGKTSVLALWGASTRNTNEWFFAFIPKVNSEVMLLHFKDNWGFWIVDFEALTKAERCWILVDERTTRVDAFDPMWAFLMKDLV